jgi:hypothetical protein
MQVINAVSLVGPMFVQKLDKKVSETKKMKKRPKKVIKEYPPERNLSVANQRPLFWPKNLAG